MRLHRTAPQPGEQGDQPARKHPVDEVLRAHRLAVLGLQHLFIMYAGAVAAPLIVGGALKLPPTTSRDPARQVQTAVLWPPHDVIPKVVPPTSRNLYLPGHAGDNTHRPCQTKRFPCRPTMAVPLRGA
jgi:hypothetical protein